MLNPLSNGSNSPRIPENAVRNLRAVLKPARLQALSPSSLAVLLHLHAQA